MHATTLAPDILSQPRLITQVNCRENPRIYLYQTRHAAARRENSKLANDERARVLPNIRSPTSAIVVLDLVLTPPPSGEIACSHAPKTSSSIARRLRADLAIAACQQPISEPGESSTAHGPTRPHCERPAARAGQSQPPNLGRANAGRGDSRASRGRVEGESRRG